MKCAIFDIDVSLLTAQQLKDRCSGCLEHTGGERCGHMEESYEPDQKEQRQIKTFIFTYERYKEITTSAYLVDIPHTVLCHTQNQYDQFKFFGRVFGHLIATDNPRGLAYNRNWALENMKEGEWACFWVDDVIKITKLVGPFPVTMDNQSEFKNVAITAPEFYELAQPALDEAERLNYNMVGFAVSSNTLFRGGKYNYKSLIEGGVFFIRKTNLYYDNHCQVLDDQYMTCLQIEKYGGVVRDNHILPVFGKNTSGGVGLKEERMERKMEEVKFLVNRFPNMIRIVDRKGWPYGSRIIIKVKKNYEKYLTLDGKDRNDTGL